MVDQLKVDGNRPYMVNAHTFAMNVAMYVD